MKKRTDQLVISGIKQPLKTAIKRRAKATQRSVSAEARISLEADFLKGVRK